MNNAFCILAAGRGSRLGELTASINKALLPVDNKAAISHIIEKVPLDCEIVIAVGYDKEKVKEYCLAAHPERAFVFAEVDRLEGPGSGPGYSLLCCRQHLQRPFYLCNSDTLVVNDRYFSLDINWLGVDWSPDALNFATVKQDHLTHRLTKMCDKGEESEGWAYIGLLGIKDWETFWGQLLARYEFSLGGLYEFQYIDAFMSPEAYPEGVVAIPYDWMDTGSVEGYEQAREWFEGGEILGLPKNINEITYKVGGRLIKLSLDSAKNSRRLARAELLQEHIPTLTFKGRYVMAYEWVGGHPLYAKQCHLDTWLAFLGFCESHLWREPIHLSKWPDRWFEICRDFYLDKTWDRMSAFLRSRGFEHGRQMHINGYFCQPPESYITFLDWDYLCEGIPAPIHGDLQFDNVIGGDDGRFYLIDWRECFGDSPLYGDIYYDLSKLYMGLELSYDVLKRGQFNFFCEADKVTYDYPVDSKLVVFKEIYERWLLKKGYDVQKIKTLAALHYINMSAHHPGTAGDLLFYHGVLKLALLRDWR